MEATDFFSENYPSGISGQSSKGSGSKRAHYTRDFPLGFGPQTETGFGGLSVFYRRHSVGAVKSKLGMGLECDAIKVKKDPKEVKMENPLWKGDEIEIAKVQEALTLFRKRYYEISKNGEGIRRVDLRAWKELTNEGVISNRCPSLIGPVPGVVVGQRFRYRVEMVIVGLHRHLERGIDHKMHGGKTLATCVVASEEHSDTMNDTETLTYVGEGGSKKPWESRDQKLRGGNLALWRSKEERSPVRVVRGVKTDICDHNRDRVVKKMKYVYDGLYTVISCEKKKGLLGSWIFEFKMSRYPGQPTVAWKGCKRNRF